MIKPIYISVAIASTFLLAACQQNPYDKSSDVIIDTKGVDMQQYQTDLYECQQYAEQVNVASSTAKTAGVGAVVGGTIGAIVGDSGTAGRGAGVGAVTGGVKGASSSLHEKQQVVKNCLRGRGYRVLN